MKKALMIATVFLMALTAQAQDEVKDLFVNEGDLIKATLYHDNGKVAQKGYFTKDGDLTGQWISFDRRGKKTAEAEYDNGSKVGTWFFWNDNTLTEVSFTNSTIAEVNTWRNEGVKVVSNNR